MMSNQDIIRIKVLQEIYNFVELIDIKNNNIDLT